MSIGISVVKELRSTNLSQLRKNTRSKGDKRSGRKRPRRNYVESELRISCVQFFTWKLPAGEDYQTEEMKQPDDWSDPSE